VGDRGAVPGTVGAIELGIGEATCTRDGVTGVKYQSSPHVRTVAVHIAVVDHITSHKTTACQALTLFDQQATRRNQCSSVRFTAQVGKRSQYGDVLVVNGYRVGVDDEVTITEETGNTCCTTQIQIT
jgi:hypothetical protein